MINCTPIINSLEKECDKRDMEVCEKDCIRCLKIQKKYQEDLLNMLTKENGVIIENNFIIVPITYEELIKVPVVGSFFIRNKQNIDRLKKYNYYVQIYTKYSDKYDSYITAWDKEFGTCFKVEFNKIANVLLGDEYEDGIYRLIRKDKNNAKDKKKRKNNNHNIINLATV